MTNAMMTMTIMMMMKRKAVVSTSTAMCLMLSQPSANNILVSSQNKSIYVEVSLLRQCLVQSVDK